MFCINCLFDIVERGIKSEVGLWCKVEVNRIFMQEINIYYW